MCEDEFGYKYFKGNEEITEKDYLKHSAHKVPL